MNEPREKSTHETRTAPCHAGADVRGSVRLAKLASASRVLKKLTPSCSSSWRGRCAGNGGEASIQPAASSVAHEKVYRFDMSFESDLLMAFEASAALERSRLAEARQKGDRTHVLQAEVALSSTQVTTLTRVLAALAAERIDGGTGIQIGKRLLAIAGPIRLDDEAARQPTPRLPQTAYRGATYAPAVRALRREARPRRSRESLAAGPVCSTCFAHGD
jgi:hypothetical protein